MTQSLSIIRVIGVNDGGAVETVVAQSTPCQTNPAPGGITPTVRISGGISITPGATATAVVVRVRQGSVSGPVMGTAIKPVTAGVTDFCSFYALDLTGNSEAVGGIVYVITVTETAATANGLLSCSGAVEVLT